MGLTQIPWHGGSRLCLCGPRDVSASSPSGSGMGPREGGDAHAHSEWFRMPRRLSGVAEDRRLLL